jgi:hypothetical protein
VPIHNNDRLCRTIPWVYGAMQWAVIHIPPLPLIPHHVTHHL